jgi:hypothetical protein
MLTLDHIDLLISPLLYEIGSKPIPLYVLCPAAPSAVLKPE